MSLKQIGIAIDQLANAIAGGMADETISARAHREQWPLAEKLINKIFNDPNHCRDSYDSEVLRAQLPPEYRRK